MSVVFKETFPLGVDEFELQLPAGADILDVQMQRDQPCIWFRCEGVEPNELRNFRVAGTGHELESPRGSDQQLDYIGTFQSHDEMLVWHLFEIR